MSSFRSWNGWWRHPGMGGGAGSVQHWSFNSSHNIRHLTVLPDPLVHELVLLPPGVRQLSIRHLAILPPPVRHPASLASYLRHLATPPSLLTWLALYLARILKVPILHIMFLHRLLILLVRMLKLLTWCLLIILLTERMMLLMTLVLFLAILLLLNMLLFLNMLLSIMLVLMFLTILLLSQLDLLAWFPALLLSSSCGELLYALSDILNTVSCSSLGLSYCLLWGVVWKPLLLLVVPVPLTTWVQGHLWGGGSDSFLWQLLSSYNSWLYLLLLLLNSLVLIVLWYLVVVKVVLVVVVILIRNIVKVVILPPRTIVLILFQLSCSIHFICWWLFHHWLGCCSILILVWVEEWNCLSRLLLLRLLCLLSTPTWLLLLLVIIPGLLLLVIIPRLLLDWLLLLLLEWYLRLQLMCSSGPVTIHQYRQSEILNSFHFISFDGFS